MKIFYLHFFFLLCEAMYLLECCLAILFSSQDIGITCNFHPWYRNSRCFSCLELPKLFTLRKTKWCLWVRNISLNIRECLLCTLHLLVFIESSLSNGTGNMSLPGFIFIIFVRHGITFVLMSFLTKCTVFKVLHATNALGKGQYFRSVKYHKKRGNLGSYLSLLITTATHANK